MPETVKARRGPRGAPKKLKALPQEPGPTTYNTPHTAEWLSHKHPQFLSAEMFILLHNVTELAKKMDRLQEQMNYLAGSNNRADNFNKPSETRAASEIANTILDSKWIEALNAVLTDYKTQGGTIHTNRRVGQNKTRKTELLNDAKRFRAVVIGHFPESPLAEAMMDADDDTLYDCFVRLGKRFTGKAMYGPTRDANVDAREADAASRKRKLDDDDACAGSDADGASEAHVATGTHSLADEIQNGVNGEGDSSTVVASQACRVPDADVDGDDEAADE